MVRGLLFVVAMALTLIGPLVYAGPQLASDLVVNNQWKLADDLAIRESKCTRWYFLVSTCHIEYVDRRDRSRLGGTLNYLVIGSWSGERARLLRSSNDPNRVGTTLGIEHMQQRVISFGVFAALALAFVGVMLRLVFSDMRSTEPASHRIDEARLATPAVTKAFGKRMSRNVG